ncbi:MAG: hypothetical protein ACEQSA_02550 [Weeksellaceae bacterium]
MAEEVVHTHDSSGGMGFLLGVVLLIVVLFFLFYYGLPALQNSGTNSGTPQMAIPEEVDVNVNNGGGETGGTQ